MKNGICKKIIFCQQSSLRLGKEYRTAVQHTVREDSGGSIDSIWLEPSHHSAKWNWLQVGLFLPSGLSHYMADHCSGSSGSQCLFWVSQHASLPVLPRADRVEPTARSPDASCSTRRDCCWCWLGRFQDGRVASQRMSAPNSVRRTPSTFMNVASAGESEYLGSFLRKRERERDSRTQQHMKHCGFAHNDC